MIVKYVGTVVLLANFEFHAHIPNLKVKGTRVVGSNRPYKYDRDSEIMVVLMSCSKCDTAYCYLITLRCSTVENLSNKFNTMCTLAITRKKIVSNRPTAVI